MARYSGRVQGVGFRHTVSRIATRYPVMGYVRNLPDRTVEMVTECTEAEFQEFQQAIDAVFRRNIDECRVTQQAATGEFSRFEVRQ